MVSSVASVSRVTNSSRRCFSQRSLRRCCVGVSGTLEPVSVMSCPLLPLGSGASLERPTELVEVVVDVAEVADDLRGRPVLRVGPHGQLALGPAVQRSCELTGSLHETLEERAYGQHSMFLRRYSVARACRRSRW